MQTIRKMFKEFIEGAHIKILCSVSHTSSNTSKARDSVNSRNCKLSKINSREITSLPESKSMMNMVVISIITKNRLHATKSKLMPVKDLLAQEGSDEDVNKNDTISVDTVVDMDLSSVIPREDEESESTTDHESLRQGIWKDKDAKSSSSSPNRQKKDTGASRAVLI